MGPLALCCSHGQGGRVGCFNQIQSDSANVRNMKFNQRVRLARGLSHLLSDPVRPLAAHQRDFEKRVV